MPVQIADLNKEKAEWEERLSLLNRSADAAEDENRRLKLENEQLKDELKFLRSELTAMGSSKPHRNGKRDGEGAAANGKPNR
mmetsp:Transcript_19785/g.58702  ORF Transcript_19785/g.58702 Transcript_19785/m.58702 type:complete len:82 (-) Transcript_19785:98-343(-)